ncbi:Holliday junction DNA helicase subunit RuvA [Breznakibacter xylanolyticus]|uniref:Holliday junction branch migration complex subunit RuvA n=1 Tax=Breznakibacter xylanolyticus TaxID=990 RepID=A0A2W7NM70_9BACT|nr:Holliday junction branch migration protein RuvA [Breznakibacter xylanolyticus]PZX20653.1 Holliday junction DNA helicase subunit RuvA [Breznakibacter xylanolyticus]
MYEYIKGELVEHSPAHAVVECGAMGYFINISLNTYTAIQALREVQLYLHQVVREDAHLLFGFADKGERDVFRHLISVSGVGVNTARMILSSASPDEVRAAIVAENVNILKSVKGIGLKTAQRVIIELKDKLSKEPVGENFLSLQNNTAREEALSALVMLGFAKAASQKVVDKLLSEQPSATVESVIKQALKML